MPPDTSDTLQAEKDYLKTSRAALAVMREKTGALEVHSADRVNQEYLQAAIWRRMKELEDDPDVPLFFGRLDYLEPTDETFHIGRRHVNDELGEPLVVDWRADISVPFYRASRTEPMGVGVRRRFGFTHGDMTAFEDEDLTSSAPADEHSDILDAEIERPRSGPMRDIVATIQPEQDVIVRAGVDDTICVQGAPGTGKTAVGLHRAAYLLYAYRDQLSRAGVLVVGPNASFLRYIGDVLPALGEIEAKQTTVEELVARVRVAGPGPAAVDVLKGDARMAEVLHRAVWSQVQLPKEALVVPRGAHRWRVAAYQAEELVNELRTRGVRYGAGRAMLPQRLAHAVLLRMEAAGDSPDDRVQDSVARSRPVKQYAEALWPAVDPAKLLFRLFTDPELLAEHADGILTPEEQAMLDLGQGAPLGRCGEVVRRRCHSDRRDRRSGRPYAVTRSRGAGRGTGPVGDAAARSRTALLDRLDDCARRHRPGHHSVGHTVVGRSAEAPGQDRRPHRGADRRLPRPRPGDRVRRPPPPHDRTTPHPAHRRTTGAR